jgi:tetratricopeptide (TPR) repeat protein
MKYLALAAICLGAATAAFAQDNNPSKSGAEAAAVQAMLQAQTPDDQIKRADELISKYPGTNYKAYALFTEAGAWEQKGDHAKAIAYCEKALAADPKDFDAEILMANVIASNTTDGDPDKADKLARAEKAAKHALDAIKTAPKPHLFQMTDAEWTNMKNSATSQAWQVLAMAATMEKKADEAIADYEKGLALTPDPGLMIRAGRALEAFQKYDDALGWFDKAIASPEADAQLKYVAAKDKVRVAAEKARSKPE